MKPFRRIPFRSTGQRVWSDTGRTINNEADSPVGLGDWLEGKLAAAGISEDRYRAVKEAVGLTPTCNCHGRKEWLNKLGEALGESTDKLRAALGWQ